MLNTWFLRKKLFSLVSAAPPELAHCRSMQEFKTKRWLRCWPMKICG